MQVTTAGLADDSITNDGAEVMVIFCMPV